MKRIYRIAHDIECYPNFFSIAIVALESDNKKYFEISPWRNDINEIRSFYQKVGYAVGFNSKSYDDFVLLAVLESRNTDWQSLCELAYSKSCESIESEFTPRYKAPWVQVDLMLYWSRMTRKAKKISLKGLAIAIGWHWIKELPVAPGTVLTKEQALEMPPYNMNDSLITKALHNGRMRKDVEFRVNLYKKYGKDYMSSDAPALGMDIFLDSYCKEMGISKWDLKEMGRPNPVFQIGEVIMPEFKEAFQGTNFEKEYKKFYEFKHVPECSLSMSTIYGGCKISLGLGGIHSIDPPELIIPKPGWKYVSSDATSYYPNLASGGKRLFFPRSMNREVLKKIYKETFLEGRVKYKKLAKQGDSEAMLLNELFKLILNSYTGNLKNAYSIFSDSWANVGITVNGQLGLLLFAYWVVSAKFILKSLNTDGIEVMYPSEREEEYMAICKRWEDFMSIPLEHTYFTKCFRRDVNNYMAIDSKTGELKSKGFFKDPNLEDAHSFQIVPKAFQNWFLTGENPHEFIRRKENSILDFCDSPKSDRKYQIIWGDKRVQRLNRFYVSKKGKYIYKKDTATGSMHNLLKDYGVQLANMVDPENLSIVNYPDIDFSFYDTQIRDLMVTVIPPQTKLF